MNAAREMAQDSPSLAFATQTLLCLGGLLPLSSSSVLLDEAPNDPKVAPNSLSIPTKERIRREGVGNGDEDGTPISATVKAKQGIPKEKTQERVIVRADRTKERRWRRNQQHQLQREDKKGEPGVYAEVEASVPEHKRVTLDITSSIEGGKAGYKSFTTRGSRRNASASSANRGVLDKAGRICLWVILISFHQQSI